MASNGRLKMAQQVIRKNTVIVLEKENVFLLKVGHILHI